MSSRVKIFLILLAFVVIAGYLARVYVDAKSPSSVKFTIYKVEFMADKSDPRPLTVFTSSTGKTLDFVGETGAFMARGERDGYSRIRLTVKNGYTMSIARAEDNPCGGPVFSDQVFLIDDKADANSPVTVDFASPEDGGGTWKGSQVTNMLVGPLTVNRERAGEVKLRFIPDDSLFCLNGEVARRAPWSVWPEHLQAAPALN